MPYGISAEEAYSGGFSVPPADDGVTRFAAVSRQLGSKSRESQIDT